MYSLIWISSNHGVLFLWKFHTSFHDRHWLNYCIALFEIFVILSITYFLLPFGYVFYFIIDSYIFMLYFGFLFSIIPIFDKFQHIIMSIAEKRQQNTLQKIYANHQRKINLIRRRNNSKPSRQMRGEYINADKQIEQIQNYEKHEAKIQKQKLNELQQSTVTQISDFETKLDRKSQDDVIRVVEKQIQQNQKNVDTKNEEYYKDSHILFKRSNYEKLVKYYCQKIEKFNEQQAKSAYLKFMALPQGKIIRLPYLKAKLDVLSARASSYEEGWPTASKIIESIKNEMKQMEQSPRDWFENYLIYKKGKDPESQQFQQDMNSSELFSTTLSERYNYLEQKQKYVRNHIVNYGGKLQKQKLQRVQTLIKMAQQREQMNMAHKKILMFAIHQQKQQIQKLNSNLTNIENENIENKNIIRKKESQISDLHQKQQVFRNEIAQLDSFLEAQKKIIIQQNSHIANMQLLRKQQQQQNIQLKISVNAEFKEIQRLKQQNFDLLQQNQQLRIKLVQLNEQQLKNKQQMFTLFQANIKTKQEQLKNHINEKQAIYLKQKQKSLNSIKQKQKAIEAYESQIKQIVERNIRQKENFQARVQKQLDEKILENNKKWEVKTALQDLKYKKQFNEARQLLKNKEEQFQKFKLMLAKKYQQQSRKFNEQYKKIQFQKQRLKKQFGEKSKQMQNYINQIKSTQSELISKIQKNQLDIEQDKKSNQIILSNFEQKYKQAQTKAQKAIKQLEQSTKIHSSITKQLQKQIQNVKQQAKIRQLKQQQQLQAKDMTHKTQKTQKELLVRENAQLKLKQVQKRTNYLKFFRWNDLSGQSQTIRQCFKGPEDEKWICSTRGISYPLKKSQIIMKTISQWTNKQILDYKHQRLQGTNIIEIRDKYKNKYYYSLRQGYYYNNQFLPTRRGFNIESMEISKFQQNIKGVVANQLIKNSSPIQ